MFFADTTVVKKQDFKEVKKIIIRQAQSKHRQEDLDKISAKLDSILISIPDTAK